MTPADVEGVVSFLLVYLAFVPMLLVAYRFVEHELRSRSRTTLRVIEVALGVQLVLPFGDPTTIVTIALAGVVLPIACFRGHLRERVLVAALLITSVAIAEVMGISLWKVLTGGAPASSWATSWQHYPEHVVSSLFGALVMALVLRGFSRQLPDVLACLDGGQYALSAYLVTQSIALLLTSVACMFDSPATGPIFWASSALCVLSLVADVEVFRAAGRLRVRGEERRWAQFYARYVERLAAQTREELSAMAEEAMLRHDLRNHVTLLRALIDEGELAEAERYAREVARGCAASVGEKGEGVDCGDGGDERP